MMTWERWRTVRRGLAAAGLVGLCGCGSDANLAFNNNPQCEGSGPQIRGVVRLPHGRLARHDGVLQRVAALLVAPVEALTGNVARVGRGVRVELVELRPEDLASVAEPGVVAQGTTNGKGEFCVALARDTTVDVCRYLLRVGDRDDGTRTRAFVYSSDAAIDVDYASEATVAVILDDLPPAEFCDVSPDEIADILQAVRDVRDR